MNVVVLCISAGEIEVVVMVLPSRESKYVSCPRCSVTSNGNITNFKVKVNSNPLSSNLLVIVAST